MLECRIIKKREFSGGELQKMWADHKRCSDNAYIKLFFDILETKRIDTLELLGQKGKTEETTEFYRGYAQAFKDARNIFDKLIRDVDASLNKAG